MSGRAIRISSRIAFAACGLVSLFTAAPYVILRGAELPVQNEWIFFVIALAGVGVFSLAVAAAPRAWIAKACGKDRDDTRLYSAPLKLLGGFAVIFYLLALVAFLAPRSWNPDPQIMLSLCPMYFIKTTIDPSLPAVFGVFAPMNAGAYGALGVTVGYAWSFFRRRNSPNRSG